MARALPVATYRRRLGEERTMTEPEFAALEAAIAAEIDDAVAVREKQPPSPR